MVTRLAKGCSAVAVPVSTPGRVPVSDVMLAQKLWIETDENMFLIKAAPYPLRY